MRWVPCEAAPSDESRIPAGAECGQLSVPVDYAKPDGDVAQLAMIRFKATGDKIGSLVINPGRPRRIGRPVGRHLVATLPQSVRERFDLVGFDPRGVARSTPAVWCNSDADNDRLRADPQVDYSPEGVAHIDNETKDFVQRCVDKTGKEFLANVGTANVVKDLDAIRVALGDDKLTYLGYSYGTRIGAAYAEEFPQNVRAMVLDGASTPMPTRSRTTSARPRRSRRRSTTTPRTAPRPDLPAGHRPGQGRRRLQSMVDPLVEKPAKTRIRAV